MPFQLRTATFSPSAAEHNLRKIPAICTEPWAFRRLHEVFADHRHSRLLSRGTNQILAFEAHVTKHEQKGITFTKQAERPILFADFQ